jgi:hypothetical protein
MDNSSWYGRSILQLYQARRGGARLSSVVQRTVRERRMDAG